MTNTNFYGGKLESLSYLEFGSIDFQSGSKNVYDFKMHSKAYDWLMNARYSNDIVAYQDMHSNINAPDLIIELFDNEIHHPDDVSLNISKWIALETLQKHQQPASFFELGQTLFGCIEGLGFVQQFLNQYLSEAQPTQLDLKQVQWLGMDISHYFNTLSKLMHSGYDVQTSDDLASLPSDRSFFFAKGITLLYAIREASQLFGLLENSMLGLFDYSLSLGETEERVIGTGKNVSYLGRDDFFRASEASSGSLWVRARTSRVIAEENRIHLDAVWGKDDLVSSYIARDQQIRSMAMNTLDTQLQPLFFQTPEDDNTWIPLETFLDSL